MISKIQIKFHDFDQNIFGSWSWTRSWDQDLVQETWSTVAGGANRVSAAPDPAGDAGWLLASLSDLRVGDDGTAGVVARVAGPDTDSVYRILRTALEPLGRELGAPPFAERGLA